MTSNKELATMSQPLRLGVQIHRAIDHQTDNHSSMRDLVRLLRVQHRKYAPVVADILLDHVLVLNWQEHSNVGFNDFEEWVYETVNTHRKEAPHHLQKRLDRMVSHRWLHQYTNLNGLQHVLNRMDDRARFPSNFASAIQDFHIHYSVMQDVLNVIISDLSTTVDKMHLGLSPQSEAKS